MNRQLNRYSANRFFKNDKQKELKSKKNQRRSLGKSINISHKQISCHTQSKPIFQSGKLSSLGNIQNYKHIRNTAVSPQCSELKEAQPHLVFERFLFEHRKQKKKLEKNCMKFSRAHLNTQTENHDKNESYILNPIQIPYEITADLSKIFDIVSELESFGFSEKTVSQWMSRYLSKKNIHITEIFMKIHINEKSLNNALTYERETKINKSLQKLKECAQKFPISKSQFLLNQIRQFRVHMEDILIRKTASRLVGISTFFRDTNTVRLKKISPNPPSLEVKHFMNDLKSLQERNGQLKMISKINRIKFQMLSHAEQAILKKCY